MNKFEIDGNYKSVGFMGHEYNFKCISRTEKTVKLLDTSVDYLYPDEEIVTKRIRTSSTGEYVIFSKDEMGWCEMEVRA